MDDISTKRQAYSFAFPPDKKQAIAAIAAEKYQRPVSWLLLAAIDQIIANGGLEPPVAANSLNYVSRDNFSDLAADVADLREQLAAITVKQRF
jgi:hypothetical protein